MIEVLAVIFSGLSVPYLTKGLVKRADYSASRIITLSETTKLVIAIIYILKYDETFSRKIVIPGLIAVLYYISTVIKFTSTENLDISLISIIFQAKLVGSMILCSLFLNANYSLGKWISGLVCTLGIIIVQYQPPKSDKKYTRGDKDKKTMTYYVLLTFLVPIISSICSILMIMQLKNESIFQFNLNLASFTLIIHFMKILTKSGCSFSRSEIMPTSLQEITLVFVIGCSGMVIGQMVKSYGDMQKNLATAVSLIISCFIDSFFMGVEFSWAKKLGTFLVVISLAIYSY